MQVRQISVFLENRAGRLQEITKIIADADINIRALALADTSDFGILRLIVNKPDETVKILRDAGFTIRENTVIACAVQDQPGGLNKILRVLSDVNINVEYMYGFVEKDADKAVMVIRVEDTEKAISILLDHDVKLLKGEQIFKSGNELL